MSMVEKSAEEFARRAYDLNLLDQRQVESVWAELGSRNVSATDMQRVLVRRGLLTNYQVDRLTRGEKAGFFHGDYKVLYLVGTGSFARVYRAVQKDTGKVVAVKVLRKRFSDDPVTCEQFIREGEMGAKLRHPNIVPIYEVHSSKKSHFMVMDFIEGRNLREFVRVRKKLSVEEGLKFTTDIAAGLTYAAEFGIRHRDLKLSNVLMSSTGRAQLVDFGLAAISGLDDESSDAVNPRTIDYAGLERSTGVRKDDLRSDIYFTGCMFYHMLTGQAPLVETKDRSQRLSKSRFEAIKPIEELEPELPHRVAMVVKKAMELNVTRRYQTPAELLADLRMTTRRLKSTDDAQGTSVTDEGRDKTVMIIDSNSDMQNVFRQGLKKVGYRVLVISDPNRALERCDTQEHVADCIVFGCHSLGKAGVEIFNRFSQMNQTKEIPAILLLAENQKALAQKALLDDHRVVAKMPLKMKQFRGVLKKLLS
ncbi:MAG: protein kinase [Pirellulaceae bacterium]|nr:protein kinase [Pirellulaceae bacterium]